MNRHRDADTEIGGRSTRFPTTRRSAVAAAGSRDPAERTRALDTLVAAYWKPVYKYLRWKWTLSSEDAKDSTQAFFARAIEKRFFDGFDPARARFRTYLRVCLDGFVSNERKFARRLKRAPESGLLSLDFESADGELRRHPPLANADVEEYFHREWVRNLFSAAVDRLRADCERRGKEIAWKMFEIYDLEETAPEEASRPTYEALGARFGVSVTAVTNALAFARREFRRIALEILHDSTGSEEEFRSEARALFGVEPL